jgi:calcium-dependent protein kinase
MNIIKAYETFLSKAPGRKQLMIVMELCTGGDLFARIPYTEQQAAHITKQILSAVSYIHDRNIIHRDLKFENIIFESNHPQAPIKVIDFGLSKE